MLTGITPLGRDFAVPALTRADLREKLTMYCAPLWAENGGRAASSMLMTAHPFRDTDGLGHLYD